MSYNQNYQQNNQQGGQQSAGPLSFAEITVMAYLADDPTSNQVGNELVGKARLIINHQNGDTDSWFIDVWTNNNGQSRGQYDFLMNYCTKGKKVLVTGRPMLQNKKQQDGSYKSFPTIRVRQLVGADSASGNQQNNAQPQGGYQQPPQQGGYQPPAQGGYQPPHQPQGGYQPPQPPAQGGYQPPQQGNMPPQQGNYPPAPPAPGGAYQPPTPGGYGAPAPGGYQPPNQ